MNPTLDRILQALALGFPILFIIVATTWSLSVGGGSAPLSALWVA